MKTRSKRWSSDGDIFGVVLFLKASLLETVLGSWHYRSLSTAASFGVGTPPHDKQEGDCQARVEATSFSGAVKGCLMVVVCLLAAYHGD
jgi:hypothetical protein